MRLIGHSDQAGRSDGQQIMVRNGYAYIGHVCSKGFSVIDVRDPTKPKTVAYVQNPPNTWSLHLQVHDDLLLLVHGRDMFSQAEMADERNYYKPQSGSHGAHVLRRSARLVGRHGGLRHFQARGAAPDRLHAGRGRWASSHLVCRRPLGLRLGDDRRLFRLHSRHHRHADPTKPEIVGRYWLPGMNLAAGETAELAARTRPLRPPPRGRRRRHRLLRLARRLPGERRRVRQDAIRSSSSIAIWSPPFGGGTHNCLPLPDRNLLIVLDEAVLDNMEDGFKPIWVFDNQVKSNPISIATFPLPNDRDYVAVGGHFGPHNIHENRPGSFPELHADLRHLSERRRQGLRHRRSLQAGRSRRLRAAGAEEARRSASEPAGRAALGRRLRRQEWPLLLHRLERRRASTSWSTRGERPCRKMSSAPAGPPACKLTWPAWGLSRVSSLLFARASSFSRARAYRSRLIS